MNYLKQNFDNVIKSWMAKIALHQQNIRARKDRRRHGKALKEAIRQADEMHKATGRAYYVMKDYNGELRVLDKASIQTLKKFKVMDKAVTVMDLLTEVEYSTINNHFLLLVENANGGKSFMFFRGTIHECLEKYKFPTAKKVEILGGFERVVTITEGKVYKH